MPWVTEQEQKDLIDKVDETMNWLEEKMEGQAKLTLLDEPFFTMEDFEKELTKLNKLAKRIFGKKKPKEKKPKKEESEEKAEETSDAKDEQAEGEQSQDQQ